LSRWKLWPWVHQPLACEHRSGCWTIALDSAWLDSHPNLLGRSLTSWATMSSSELAGERVQKIWANFRSGGMRKQIVEMSLFRKSRVLCHVAWTTRRSESDRTRSMCRLLVPLSTIHIETLSYWLVIKQT
jgi:hypothetical protein